MREHDDARAAALRLSSSVPKTYHVYILASRTRVLYVGVSSALARRMYQHKNGLLPGFTSRYHVDRLVYVEDTSDVRAALEREKQLKRWPRARKVALIRRVNPEWRDLAAEYRDSTRVPSNGTRRDPDRR